MRWQYSMPILQLVSINEYVEKRKDERKDTEWKAKVHNVKLYY